MILQCKRHEKYPNDNDIFERYYLLLIGLCQFVWVKKKREHVKEIVEHFVIYCFFGFAQASILSY